MPLPPNKSSWRLATLVFLQGHRKKSTGIKVRQEEGNTHAFDLLGREMGFPEGSEDLPCSCQIGAAACLFFRARSRWPASLCITATACFPTVLIRKHAFLERVSNPAPTGRDRVLSPAFWQIGHCHCLLAFPRLFLPMAPSLAGEPKAAPSGRRRGMV